MLSLKVPKIKFPVSVEPGQHRHPPATLMLQAQLTRGQGHRRTAAAPLLTRFALNPLNNLQGTLCNTSSAHPNTDLEVNTRLSKPNRDLSKASAL